MINVIQTTGIFKVKIKKYESQPEYWSSTMFEYYSGKTIDVIPVEFGTSSYDNGYVFMAKREKDKDTGLHWYFKAEDIEEQIPQWVDNLQNLFEGKL